MITLGPSGNGLQTFGFGLKVEKQSPLPPNAICSFASKTYKHYLSYIMFSCNERPLARMCLCLLSCNGKTYMLFIICATQHLLRILYCFANCKNRTTSIFRIQPLQKCHLRGSEIYSCYSDFGSEYQYYILSPSFPFARFISRRLLLCHTLQSLKDFIKNLIVG